MQPTDPYAQQQALEEWAQSRSYQLSQSPDPSWYRAWEPLTYVTRPARLGRELRASFGEVIVALAETFEDDPIKQATGEDRHLMGFVICQGLRHRAALRSKKGAGDLTDFGRSIGALFGGARPGTVLGDPTFEEHYEVQVPSREEGIAALPMALRQLLLGAGFLGALDIRPGGMVMQFYGHRDFDPAKLDAVSTLLGQTYQAATGG